MFDWGWKVDELRPFMFEGTNKWRDVETPGFGSQCWSTNMLLEHRAVGDAWVVSLCCKCSNETEFAWNATRTGVLTTGLFCQVPVVVTSWISSLINLWVLSVSESEVIKQLCQRTINLKFGVSFVVINGRACKTKPDSDLVQELGYPVYCWVSGCGFIALNFF